jgi:Arc/MetJ-type ribon-helix-helix transcriptional regulator
MADVVVAVRVPRSLVAELRERTERDHYSDLSEQVRSIVRRGCLKYTNPVTHEIKELKEQLKAELLKEQAAGSGQAILQRVKELLESQAKGQGGGQQ